VYAVARQPGRKFAQQRNAGLDSEKVTRLQESRIRARAGGFNFFI